MYRRGLYNIIDVKYKYYFSGYSCHGGWREPLDEPDSESMVSSTNLNQRRSKSYTNRQQQNHNYNIHDRTELSQNAYSSNYQPQQKQHHLEHPSQASRSLEMRKDNIRSQELDQSMMMNRNKNMNEMNGLDLEEGSQSPQQHLSSYVQYLIVSPLTKSSSDKNPHLSKRLCARIIVQNPVELSFVTLVADEDECPTRDDITNDMTSGSRTKNSYNVDNSWNRDSRFTPRKTKWRFNLTRTSKEIYYLDERICKLKVLKI